MLRIWSPRRTRPGTPTSTKQHPLPALRARTEDIPALVNYFVDSYNTEFRKRLCGVTDDAMRRLQTYGWPGNIRELRNVVERSDASG